MANKTKEFGLKTPEAKNNRLNWSLVDMEASEVLNVDARMSKTGKPYLVMDFKERPAVCVLVEQAMFDQEQGKTKFIVSREGKDLEVNLDVNVGIKDGALFFI